MAQRDEERGSEELDTRHLRDEIASTRQALEEKVDALGTRARQVFDLEHQMQTHPLALIGASTGAGFLAGTLLSGSPAPSVPAEVRGFRASEPPRERGEHPWRDSELASSLKVAALSLLAGFLRRTVRERSPAWADEIDRVWSEQGLDELLSRRTGKRSEGDPLLTTPLTATKDVQ